MGELAGGTKTWAGSAVEPCTPPADLCTSTFLHTHSSAHTSTHIHSRIPVDTHALGPATHLCTLARVCMHTRMSMHTHKLSCASSTSHQCPCTPMYLCIAHLSMHMHPCAHLHALTLSIPPLGPPAIPFILWPLRITMPAGEEAVLPPALWVDAMGTSPGQAFLASWVHSWHLF